MSVNFGKSRQAFYYPDQNVSLWLHRLNVQRVLRQWPDSVALLEASLLMSDVPLTWFVTHCNAISTWAEFDTAMRQRFGDSEQTVMTHILHRTQKEDESVQSYVDDMNLMFSQSLFPDAMKRDLLLQNLKPQLRKQVIVSIPSTMDDVIKNATFLEDKFTGRTAEKVKAWQQHTKSTPADPVDRLAEAMDKLSLGLSLAGKPATRSATKTGTLLY